MNKVRIDEPGWEAYTGLVGLVPFENGVSTRPLTDLELARISANLKVVNENDEQLGIGVTCTLADKIVAAVEKPLERGTVEKTVTVETPVKETESVTHKYTRDELESIADAGGIKAIRKIGNEFGVKGVQITGMIEEILEAQGE